MRALVIAQAVCTFILLAVVGILWQQLIEVRKDTEVILMGYSIVRADVAEVRATLRQVADR